MKRSTINSTMFSGDAATLAVLLVRNTKGDAKALKLAQDTINLAWVLVPGELEKMQQEANARVQREQEKANSIAANLQQSSELHSAARDLVVSRMVEKLVQGGIAPDAAMERALQEVKVLDSRINTFETRLQKQAAKTGKGVASTANTAKEPEKRKRVSKSAIASFNTRTTRSIALQ